MRIEVYRTESKRLKRCVRVIDDAEDYRIKNGVIEINAPGLYVSYDTDLYGILLDFEEDDQ